jgi:hypothetical protein
MRYINTNTIKTQKGTELPLMNLKGKNYLQVAYRLVWFREEHPEWSIETEYLSQDAQQAVARAVIKDLSGRIIAVAHKEESAKDFPQGHREKAETGAIGRALGLCGYGTQFEPEFDEEERVVDSPITPKNGVGVHPEQPNAGDGIPKEGYAFKTLPKELVDRLGFNPSGSILETQESSTLNIMASFFEDKYGATDKMPPGVLALYEKICGHMLSREGALHG